MTELSGTLEGVGLPAIVRFLGGLKKTGCLRIVHDDWQGEIVFEAGRLTDASLGSRQGLSALDGLVQSLPGGSFTFDTSSRGSSAPSIVLSPEALETHLDELVARIASGTPTLPSIDAVPQVVAQEESGVGEDPLPLDRGTLQTLLAVDGQRSVRAIVAHRGTFDALWQLGSLGEVGLVRLAFSSTANPSATTAEARPAVVEAPRVEAAGPEAAARAEAPIASMLEVEPQQAPAHCPKLGFEDDSTHSFDRPTRLHRCFAAGTPLPLSLDQQRELCLSDQFGTCPRLSMVGRSAARPPARDFSSAQTVRGAAAKAAPALGVAGRSEALPSEPESDDPRIVRLPFGARKNPPGRGGFGDRQTGSASEPTQMHSSSSALRGGDSPRPTPLRARIDRSSRAASATAPASAPEEAEPVVVPTYEPRTAQPTAVRELVDDTRLSRFGGMPTLLIVRAAVVVTALVVLGMIAYMVVPNLGSLFADDNADLSALPNASAAAAGTPVAALTERRTPVAIVPSDSTSASAASAALAPAAPTLVPEAAPAPAEATVATSPSPAPQSPAGQSATGQSPAAQPATPTLLDERFTNNTRNWPSNPQGTAWLTSGSYRLIPRQAGQFVAVGAPIANPLQDVTVSATFRKLSGTPEGGGFGIIVRNQGTAPLDGTNQGGQYYVLEVGDKGEVGIWRRAVDKWIDILPWQHADAVHPGTATNELTVSAIGNRLSMSVNGTQVASQADNTFSTGTVGLLVGGDGNQVAVDHFSIQTP